MGGAGERDRGWPVTTSSAPDVGLVLAAAMAPGTFAPSLSARTALDQGLVTGLATGLHFLLAAGAQDALVATARFLVDGTPSPAARRTATIAVDAAAVPVGLAVLRALPPRADDPLRGVVRQAAWRLGSAGLGGALLSGAQAGTRALDDRLRLGGRLARCPSHFPSASPSPMSSSGSGRARRPSTDGGRSAAAVQSLAVATGIVGCLAGVAYGERALTELLARRLAGVLPGPPSCGGWPATPASWPAWGSAPPRCGTGRCGGSSR